MKPRDARVAAAQISGRLVREIAAAEGVTKRQVFRRLAKPDVRAEIDRSRREQTRAAGLVISAGLRSAAGALLEIATGQVEARQGQVAAAVAVRDWAVRFIELEELERRLRELERLAAGAGDDAGGKELLP